MKHSDQQRTMTPEAYAAKQAAYREQIKSIPVTTDSLLLGGWVSFVSFETESYESQLDRMAAAGVNFNIFPRDFNTRDMYDAAYWQDVEEQYAKRNMVYCMNGRMDHDFVALGVEYAAGKERCIGYQLIDEPGGGALPEVAERIKAYRKADPARYPFVNLFPSYAGPGIMGGTYYEYVSRFVELAGAENIDYLSHDFYPFTEGTNTASYIFEDMEVLRKVAYENGKLKTHAFPQSTEWPAHRLPNIDEMRWNVYGYLAYGFKALSWFNIVCPGPGSGDPNAGEGFSESIIYRDGSIHNPQLFADWGELNWEIRGLSPVLMRLDTVHAYHVTAMDGEVEMQGVERLPKDFFLQPVSHGEDQFIISCMEPKEGDDAYVMLFNKHPQMQPATATFSVDAASGVKWVEYFDPRIGEYIPVDISDGVLTDDFLPGEGKLYRLRYDEYETETEAEAETVTEAETRPGTEAETDTAPLHRCTRSG